VAEQVRGKQVPLAKFVVTKQLTKRPEDYPDARNQPHVQVALRRRAAGLRNGTMQVRDAAQTCLTVAAC
jgi:DNA polymerase alpha subunit A